MATASPIPTHLAIIMDGNGRWAQAKNLPRTEGHLAGLDAVQRVIKACIEHSIPILSLFAFSSENWQRPQAEVDTLMQLFSHSLKKEINDLHASEISLRFTGNLTQLSPSLQAEIAEATEVTQHHKRLILNIVINYGGKWDILQATERLFARMQHQPPGTPITEADFDACLATAPLPPPDLFIRTSGEQRISNFFLWQLAYTELYFTNTLWPDFGEADLHAALKDFQQRQRRFGRLDDQEDAHHA